jgi:hypothetical protein
MATVIGVPEEPSLPMAYPQLAKHMSDHPDSAVFRRYGALNFRNLLYYQAELDQLEEKLEEVERLNHELCESGRGRDFASKWYWLGGGGSDEHSKVQLALVLEIREVVRQYS